MSKYSTLLIVLAIAAVLAGLVFILNQSPTTSVSVSQVNETSDLDKVDEELSEEELDDIDSELEKLDEDSSF